MLIQQAEYSQIWSLTRRFDSGMTASGGDEGRLKALFGAIQTGQHTQRALMAWADIIHAVLASPGAVVDIVPGTGVWKERGKRLLTAAGTGDLDALETAAGDCISSLDDTQLQMLVGHFARVMYRYAELAGGLDRLAIVALMHQVAAPHLKDVWRDPAAWIVARLMIPGSGREPEPHARARLRLVQLIMQEQCPVQDLLHAWLALGAEVIPPSTPELSKSGFESVVNKPGLPAYQNTRRALKIAQDKGPQAAADSVASVTVDTGAMMAWDLAHAISFHLHHALAEPDNAAPVSAVQPEIAEQTHHLRACGHRAILAFIDEDRQALADIVNTIVYIVENTPRRPGALHYTYVMSEIIAHISTFWDIHEQVGGVDTTALTAGAEDLLARLAPPRHRDEAIEVAGEALSGIDPRHVDVSLSRGVALVLGSAAAAGWLATRPNAFPEPEVVRLKLQEMIREAEADALGVPGRERVTTIPDQEARAFLERLLPRVFPQLGPDDRGEWAPGGHAVMALIKEHLLHTPASATTPEQERQLKEAIIKVLHRALAQIQAATPGATHPAPKAKAKKKPKRPPRHKPKRRKK